MMTTNALLQPLCKIRMQTFYWPTLRHCWAWPWCWRLGSRCWQPHSCPWPSCTAGCRRAPAAEEYSAHDLPIAQRPVPPGRARCSVIRSRWRQLHAGAYCGFSFCVQIFRDALTCVTTWHFAGHWVIHRALHAAALCFSSAAAARRPASIARRPCATVSGGTRKYASVYYF